MTEMSRLRRHMIDDMNGPDAAIVCAHAFVKFGRSPDKLDLEDVRAFRVHLGADPPAPLGHSSLNRQNATHRVASSTIHGTPPRLGRLRLEVTPPS